MDLNISTKQAGLLASIPTGALIAELEKRLAEVNLMRSAAARMLANLSDGLGLAGNVTTFSPADTVATEVETEIDTAAKAAEKKQKDEDRLAAMRAGYKGKGATQRWIADGKPSKLANPEQEQPGSETGIPPEGSNATETPEAA